MDLSSVKSESPAKYQSCAKKEGDQTHLETEIVSYPDIKAESLDYYGSLDQGEGTSKCTNKLGSTNVETVPIKAEPGPQEEDAEGIPYTEIDIDLLDVKKECSEHSESITITTDSKPTKDKPKEDRKVAKRSEPCSVKSFMERINTEYKKEYNKIPAKGQRSRLKNKKNKVFSCDQCGSAFSFKTGIDRHMLTHSGEKPFSCDQCSSAFTQKSSLQRHMLSHTGVKPFACYLCSFTCSVSISLTRHILTHTGEKPFSCLLCDYTCSQKYRLKNHIRRHNEKSQKSDLEALRTVDVNSSAPQTEVAGTYSETEHASSPDIKVESLDHYGSLDQSEGTSVYTNKLGSINVETVPIKIEPGPREEDGVGVPYSEIDIDHSINTEYKKTAPKDQRAKLKGKKTKIFPCDQCNAVFPKKNQLEIHLNVHTGEKPFSCSYCSSVFSQKSNWKTHMLVHEGVKPFVCPHCSAAFTRKMCLKTHILSHTGERPFECTQCSSAFTHESTLKTHILTHYGLKPFSCDQCGSAFSRKTGLDRHMLTHTGEKPFPCDQCSSAFTRKSSLQTHMLSHTGVKPFACYLCSFTCSVSISLKRHILTHTGEKPFSCPLCDYRCSQKSRLKNHIRRHNEKSQKAALEALRSGDVNTTAPQTRSRGLKPGVGI